MDGRFEENDRIPSEKELMEEFNVSRITVANALTALAKEGWIYRIPGRGSFVDKNRETIPQQTAEEKQPELQRKEQMLKGNEGKMIGLIMPGIDDFFSIRLIKGIQKVAYDNDFSLMISVSYGERERESKAIKELIAKGALGLLIFPVDAELYNEEILALKTEGYPFVLIDRHLPGVETNFIASDGRLGAQIAISHLWELGHRNIALCSDTPPSTVTVDNRIQGYMTGLKEKGALIDPSLILTDFFIDYDKSIMKDDPLYRYMKNRMATAYITLNGNLGVYIYRIAELIGLKVPEDISIVTFDDPTPGFDELGFFTHIAQSEFEMGTKAAEMLVDVLQQSKNNKKEQVYKKTVLEPRLIIRQSTVVVKQ